MSSLSRKQSAYLLSVGSWKKLLTSMASKSGRTTISETCKDCWSVSCRSFCFCTQHHSSTIPSARKRRSGHTQHSGCRTGTGPNTPFSRQKERARLLRPRLCWVRMKQTLRITIYAQRNARSCWSKDLLGNTGASPTLWACCQLCDKRYLSVLIASTQIDSEYFLDLLLDMITHWMFYHCNVSCSFLGYIVVLTIDMLTVDREPTIPRF